MGETVTIELGGTIASVELLDGGNEVCGQKREPNERLGTELESEKARLQSVCATLQGIVDKFNEMYEKGISEQRTGIAKLGVEIARRILRRKTEEGDYEIIRIVEETLKEAAVREDVTVRLNPQDAEECRKAQEDVAGGTFSGVTFVADTGVGRGECIVETGRGIIASVIEEQLEKVSKALQRSG